jgi:hypothetical protein
VARELLLQALVGVVDAQLLKAAGAGGGGEAVPQIGRGMRGKGVKRQDEV